MRPSWRLIAAASLAIATIAGASAHAETPIAQATQPGQPVHGPGSNGACQTSEDSFDNSAAPGNPVYVYQPSGTATARIGDACSRGKQPTIFMAHGLGGTDPSNYIELIDHLVSRGNIVVYPTYQVTSGSKSALETAYRYMNAGNIEAAKRTKRIDVARVGFWGHSFGASMVPYLAVKAAHRGWGKHALWLNNVAMTFALLVGPGAIQLPRRAQVLTVGFNDDALADNRIGDEVFRAFKVPRAHKRHLILNSDAHGQPALVAEHNTPIATSAQTYTPDALDFALWRDIDLLETCALIHHRCHADYSQVGTWSDGTPITPGTVSKHPVDVGPYPAALAECDGVYGQMLNDERIHRCGATHI
jgi:acetyl esterase/lipase